MMWLRTGQVQAVSCCEHSNEPSGALKGREVLD